MTSIFSRYNASLLTRISLICLLALTAVVSSCDTLTSASNEGIVEVYNFDDDHGYRVELYTADSDTLVDSFYLDEYPSTDHAKYFEGLTEGYYYLSIFKDDVSDESGRSTVFYIDEGDILAFTIESELTIDSD